MPHHATSLRKPGGGGREGTRYFSILQHYKIGIFFSHKNGLLKKLLMNVRIEISGIIFPLFVHREVGVLDIAYNGFIIMTSGSMNITVCRLILTRQLTPLVTN